MSGLIFKFFGIAVAILVIFYSVANTFRKARRLDARIEEYKKSQEEKKRNGVASNPYSELAEIYAENERPSARDENPKMK